jgi:ABC-2 type transport system permease protein
MQNRYVRLFPVLSKWASQVFALVQADFQKLKHDPSQLFTRMFQPLVWILIFGQAMAKTKVIEVGTLSYLDYMVPGILAQSILLVAIFYGIAFIWERDSGSLQKTLVTPTPRILIVIGRSLAAGIRGLSQVIVVYILSFILRVDLRLSFFAILGVVCVTLLFGALFSCLSLIIASVVKKRERFMGIGQMIIMPLFFASNALYPIDLMPNWIRALSIVNPLSYQVDAFRTLMIVGASSHFGLLADFSYGILLYILFILLATKLHPMILY